MLSVTEVLSSIQGVAFEVRLDGPELSEIAAEAARHGRSVGQLLVGLAAYRPDAGIVLERSEGTPPGYVLTFSPCVFEDFRKLALLTGRTWELLLEDRLRGFLRQTWAGLGTTRDRP